MLVIRAGSERGAKEVSGMLCRVLWVVCVLTAAVASCAAVAMPTLDTVTIASNTAHPTLATIGDLIIVSFTSSEPIQSVSVTISGSEATIDGGPRSWTAEYRMQPGGVEQALKELRIAGYRLSDSLCEELVRLAGE